MSKFTKHSRLWEMVNLHINHRERTRSFSLWFATLILLGIAVSVQAQYPNIELELPKAPISQRATLVTQIEAATRILGGTKSGYPLRLSVWLLHAMITDFLILLRSDPLSHAVELILAGSPQDFPVLEDGCVLGILTRHDWLAGLTQRGQQTTVSESVQRESETVEAAEMLDVAFQ